LFDILTILQHFDHLASSARTTQSTGPLECGLHDIIAKCHRIEATLVALYAKFEASVAGPLYWPELSTLACAIDNEECGKVFPVSFHFPSCLVGHILVAYWAVVMGVHAQLVFAHAGLAAIEPASCDLGHQSSHASLSAERRAKCIAAFRNICQSVEYMKRGGAGNFQSLALIPLLGSTLRCLGEVAPVECQREAMWATEFLHVMKRQLNLPEYNLMED
jgi:hypothetical protein